ncbi:unnamed protein product [Zymoseptoria tritici ST99CH_1E4]|uniref:Uncharacterized protein n=1 Tax=Zymoseptoria tritici ST99CH_1E4 TaxID=1276532 RepID=A0A2H1GY73_ZYMTR|nr:unnamed protein product [Zymoseptoria tritici ST99CH_1E4]
MTKLTTNLLRRSTTPRTRKRQVLRSEDEPPGRTLVMCFAASIVSVPESTLPVAGQSGRVVTAVREAASDQQFTGAFGSPALDQWRYYHCNERLANHAEFNVFVLCLSPSSP